MPVRKSGKGLQQLCFIKIRENIEALNHLSILPYYLFNEFCEDNRQDCYRTQELKIYSRSLLLPPALFINRKTTKLEFWCDFPNYEPDVANQKIIVVGKISKNLRHVNFSLDRTLTPADFVTLVRSIPKVEILKLNNTDCNNDVLTEIKNSCLQIRELNLECTRINDIGIRNLCITNSDRKMTLQILNVGLTTVTAQGCLFALNSLPYMTSFKPTDTDRLKQMLVEMKSESDCVVAFPSIKDLLIYTIETRTELEALASFFPNITSFTVSLEVGVETIAENVVLFRQLNSLQLCRCHLGVGDTASIWKNCNLTSVKLFHCDVVEIYKIAHYYPNITEVFIPVLKHQSDEDGQSWYVNRSFQHTPFARLSKLWIGFYNVYVNDDVIGFLLDNSKCLKSLKFFDCQLTDSSINRMVKRNSLNDLQEVIFCRCNNITEESVKMLLMMHNPLSIFHISECKNITQCEERSLKNFIKKNNIDVTLMLGKISSVLLFD